MSVGFHSEMHPDHFSPRTCDQEKAFFHLNKTTNPQGRTVFSHPEGNKVFYFENFTQLKVQVSGQKHTWVKVKKHNFKLFLRIKKVEVT